MKLRKALRLGIFSLIVLSLLSGCATTLTNASEAGASRSSVSAEFLPSGTIIVSHAIPERSYSADLAMQASVAGNEPRLFAPLIGYFPPAHAYMPAENETWLEISRQTKTITLYKGQSPITSIKGEGTVSIASGDYYLEHKQKEPIWYAPDQYFQRRKLSVPDAGDRLRYRRGALGKYALYPTTTFPIHCGAIWSEDVGGLRISAAELSSIYYMLPVGAPIVVK